MKKVLSMAVFASLLAACGPKTEDTTTPPAATTPPADAGASTNAASTNAAPATK